MKNKYLLCCFTLILPWCIYGQAISYPDGTSPFSVQISLNRTVTIHKLIVETGPCTKVTDKNDQQIQVQVNVRSGKILGMYEDGSPSVGSSRPEEYAAFEQKFSGSGNVIYSGNQKTSYDIIGASQDCNPGMSCFHRETQKNAQGQAQVDVESQPVLFSFDYNSESKQGSTQFSTAFKPGTGTLSTVEGDCKGVREPAPDQQFFKQGIAPMGILYSAVSAFNYSESDAFKNLNFPGSEQIRQALQKTSQLDSSGMMYHHATFQEIDQRRWICTADFTATIQNPMPMSQDPAVTITGEYYTTIRTHFSVILVLGPLPPLKAIIEPLQVQEYKTWIPAGEPVVSGDPDSRKPLTFKVKLVEATNPTVDVSAKFPFRLIWELQDVSAYKGICMNYPKDQAKLDPDIQWAESMRSQPEMEAMGEVTATSKDGEGSTFFATIQSFDYAAEGKLLAHLVLKSNGQTIEAEYDAGAGGLLPYIRIPEDNNVNHVGDEWERRAGVFERNLNVVWDEDKYPQNIHPGDGHTLFEEYRGYSVRDNFLRIPDHTLIQNHHVRLDPDYKDVFVYDENDLFKIYYTRHNVTELNWHYIDQNQVKFIPSSVVNPEHRWINFNVEPRYHYAKQYILHLKDAGRSGNTNVGASLFEPAGNVMRNWNLSPQDLDFYTDKCFESPEFLNRQKVMNLKNMYIVQVFPLSIQDWTNGSGAFKFLSKRPACQNHTDQQVCITVIHEVNHALGIMHHGWENWKKEESPFWYFGVLHCPTRYGNDREVADKTCVPQYKLCRITDTFSMIDPMLPPSTTSGNINPTQYPSDNCWDQINVKSQP